jgi:hypothetical protein
MAVITTQSADPSAHPEEAAWLPRLIGQFTDAVMSHVRAAFPACRFEVLFPTDVNDTAWNQTVNYPQDFWTPAKLDQLKTESFTYTFNRDLEGAKRTIGTGALHGFPRSGRSFLVGIGDSSTAWLKEVRLAMSENLESIVLFALDQYCLIGYRTPAPPAARRGLLLGA